jgi:hypothetical protein
MSETTTIQITEEQREDLREINSGSAKAAVAVLLEAYENGNGGENVGETLAEIQASLSTVEERTGRVERTLEDMGAHR